MHTAETPVDSVGDCLLHPRMQCATVAHWTAASLKWASPYRTPERLPGRRCAVPARWSGCSLSHATESLEGSTGFLASLSRTSMNNPHSTNEPSCQFTRSDFLMGLIRLRRCGCATVAHLLGSDDNHEDGHALSSCRDIWTLWTQCPARVFHYSLCATRVPATELFRSLRKVSFSCWGPSAILKTSSSL